MVSPTIPRSLLSRSPSWQRAGWVALLVTGLAAFASAQVTRRVSVSSADGQANASSAAVSISADGRYVLFSSFANNLVAGDTNGAWDTFLRDRRLGTTTRVSVDSAGAEGNGDSVDGSHSTDAQGRISADGRRVVFESLATNLVAGDTNGCLDVFLRDLEAGSTQRVSIGAAGEQGNAESYDPCLSASGRYVAFVSAASNLVAGDTNGAEDIFVRDLATGTTRRISVDAGGGQGLLWSFWPSISADGQVVAFQTGSALVPEDHNQTFDIYVHDLGTGAVQRASLANDGTEGDDVSAEPSLSPDGKQVAFTSDATNLVPGDTNRAADVFLRDLLTPKTSRVSVSTGGGQASGASVWPSLATDGRVVFHSFAADLVAGDGNGLPDIFLRDVAVGTTSRINQSTLGVQANDYSWQPPSLSRDGRQAAFASLASNLVSDDTNASYDVFVHGQELTLEASRVAAGPGDVLELAAFGGVPGHYAGLWAVEVDGITTWQRLWFGRFSASGAASLSGTVPPGLGTFDATFRAFGIGVLDRVVATQPVVVSFH